MTVDKPPLSLWVQALSARVFGFHPLSILVPQALMGVAAVGAVSTTSSRRRFGRFAGLRRGPRARHDADRGRGLAPQQPGRAAACSAASRRCGSRSRAFETGRTRWLVLSGIAVGLGFETKMGVALMVVPGIAAWPGCGCAPRGRRLRAASAARRRRRDAASSALAWPLLVTLTPAADRPWISGTSDNSIWSLIFGYNGLGRVAGQTGGRRRRRRRWRLRRHDVRRSDRARSACCSPGSAIRPAGCSASRSSRVAVLGDHHAGCAGMTRAPAG